MADPITIIGTVGSVIQLIDFSVDVLARLNEYRSKGTELPSAFVHIAIQLPLLREVLEKSKEGIISASITPNEAKAIEPSLRGCQQQMEKLQGILAAILPAAQEGTVKRMTKGLRSIGKESEVRKIDAEIESYVTNLTFYCAWSTSKLDPRNQNMLARLEQWLAPPDPLVNLRRSLKSRSANTGRWYLQGAQYVAWKEGRASFTWLYGAAGSGKTILSAGVIEDLQLYCSDDPARSLAFFFFDFNDAEKQSPINMVKSLLGQFLKRCPRVPQELQSVHGQPTEQQLLSALKHTLELLPVPFIVLDALDECSDRNGLLDVLEQVHSWGNPTLRVLVTSRKEVEIEEALEDLVSPDDTTCLESDIVDEDIRTYVHERLLGDKSFRRWRKDQDVQEEIEEMLGRKARGMFRWAACQLDALAQCLTRGKVRRALHDLPKTLGDTYARILRTIDEGPNAEEALKLLRWLTHAKRPLTAIQLLESTGIVLAEVSRFDSDEVLKDSKDILRICSSLVSITISGTASSGADNSNNADDQSVHSEEDTEFGMEYVRLAHFSVREYLVSSRPCIARYSLQEEESHDILASSCLVYLLRFNENPWRASDCETDFPLARYAARYWTQHGRVSGACSQRQRDLAMKLLARNAPAFSTWMRFFDITDPWHPAPDIHREIAELPSPLYAACREGMVHAVRAILDDTLYNIDAQWAHYGTVLQAASQEGHKKVVEMLLAKDADVNAQGGSYGNALQAASIRGYEKVVEMLLAKDADVNAQGGSYGNALQAASSRGYEKVVEMLLAKGADINAQGGSYGNALQAASIRGHKKVVEMLLAKGADINAQGGYYGNALQAASSRGHEKVVEMLLAKGADVNAQGGSYGNALQAASSRGYEKVVEMLLAKGADVNAQGGFYGNALQAASSGGHENVVKMLLAKGALPYRRKSTGSN